jgi:hypothetical protein
MKFLTLLLVAFALMAQPAGTHSVTLTWQDGRNPTGTTYNAYRAPGACGSATAVFTGVGLGLTGLTYVDSTVSIGTYCYQVKATNGSTESAASNQAVAIVGLFAPFGLTVVVK